MLGNGRYKDVTISTDEDGKNCVNVTESEDKLKQLLTSLEHRRIFFHGINPRTDWRAFRNGLTLAKNTALITSANKIMNIPIHRTI